MGPEVKKKFYLDGVWCRRKIRYYGGSSKSVLPAAPKVDSAAFLHAVSIWMDGCSMIKKIAKMETMYIYL